MAAAVPRFDEWLPLERAERLGRALSDPPEFARLRREAQERFRSLPIEPNPLYRGYGYFTDVDLARIDPEATGAPAPVPPARPGSIRIVHDVAGTRAEIPEALVAAGIRFYPLTEIWRRGGELLTSFLRGNDPPVDKLHALATATLNRGYRLEIPDGLAAPVRLQELSILSVPNEALSLRRSIRVGRGAQFLGTEEVFAGPTGSETARWYASGIDLDLADGAKAVVLGVHAPDLKTVSVYRRTATTGAGARLAWIWNGLGGFRTKVRNHTDLLGNGSNVDDLQTFYGRGEQAYDSAVDLTHVGLDTNARSITRGVFDDRARGMSRGLVRIEASARKTISYISEHAMLLSKGARSDTIPILEILCRDVKATHSTSVAPVDPEKVFYLESRGMPRDDAIRMIGEGFLAYVHERAPVAGLRELLYPTLATRWEGRDLSWAPGRFPTLPELDVTGTETAPEWRFDTKLG